MEPLRGVLAAYRGRRVAASRLPARRRNGQSLAEFTLTAPILLIMLLTVSDFARYFATAVTIESIARNAAEVAAQQYVQQVADGTSPKNYGLVHQMAWQSVCDEGRDLPNATPGSGGGPCDGLPTLVCVHDGADSTCGTVVYNQTGAVPGNCSEFQPAVAPAATVDAQGHAYVEVRVCYRFSTFFPIVLPFFGTDLAAISGDFFIERGRHFTVADY